MRHLFFMLITAMTLLGASAPISSSEREALLQQVKETKMHQRQQLKERFKTIQTSKARAKIKQKFHKPRLKQRVKANRIRKKIRRGRNAR